MAAEMAFVRDQVCRASKEELLTAGQSVRERCDLCFDEGVNCRVGNHRSIPLAPEGGVTLSVSSIAAVAGAVTREAIPAENLGTALQKLNTHAVNIDDRPVDWNLISRFLTVWERRQIHIYVTESDASILQDSVRLLDGIFGFGFNEAIVVVATGITAYVHGKYSATGNIVLIAFFGVATALNGLLHRRIWHLEKYDLNRFWDAVQVW